MRNKGFAITCKQIKSEDPSANELNLITVGAQHETNHLICTVNEANIDILLFLVDYCCEVHYSCVQVIISYNGRDHCYVVPFQ